ncbi:MucR family transcriptional regulator [Sphingomonas panaciterrae]|uniref:MucR family transcriptional regulator n=1 Tax=Sphingomonas panaciterrae TaxID=1462999 RepID=UPI002FF12D3F
MNDLSPIPGALLSADMTVADTVAIVSALVSNPNFRDGPGDIARAISETHAALAALNSDEPAASATPAAEQPWEPAVSVRKSLASPDHIISLIDGKPYKTLRRHLAGHGLTPESYRERFGLKPDYPMVAESYSNARRDMAKKIGLGTKANRNGQG